MSRSNSALVSATAVLSIPSRLTASRYSTPTRWAMLFLALSNWRSNSCSWQGGLLVLGVAGAVLRLDVGELLAGLIQAVGELRSCSPWVDTWAASSDRPRPTRRRPACAHDRAWALVYSVLSWSRREERMLVFSSGLMTFSSRSNCANAAEERSIFAFSSSSCFSMKDERPAEARKRML